MIKKTLCFVTVFFLITHSIKKIHPHQYFIDVGVHTNGATVLIGLMEKSHKHKGFERSINSINLKIK